MERDIAETSSILERLGIGPEDIERCGYDGRIRRTPKAVGHIKLADGWFEVRRPEDANKFFLGKVSAEGGPLVDGARERREAALKTAVARGELIRMQDLARRYGVDCEAPEETSSDDTLEESSRKKTVYETDRAVVKTKIIAAYRRRQRRLRFKALLIGAVAAACVWAVIKAFRMAL